MSGAPRRCRPGGGAPRAWRATRRGPRGGALPLAWRNLWRSPRRTWLTAGAMIACNSLLVFQLGFQFGTYDIMLETALKTFVGHLQVQKSGYLEAPRLRESFSGAARLAAALRRELASDSVAARAQAHGLISSERRSLAVRVLGVEPEREPLVSGVPGSLARGRWLSGDRAREVVLGATLARNLKVGTGAEITLLGTARDGSLAAALLTVVGIVESGLGELDRGLAQMPLGHFQEVFAMPDSAHSIVADVGSLAAVAPALRRARSLIAGRPELVALDWDRLQPGLRQAIAADLASAWFLYGILILVVSLGVLNTQLMSVLERTREFGMMLALGAGPGRLARLVMLESALLALLGLVAGLGAGGLATLYFAHTGLSFPGLEAAMERYNLPGTIYPRLSPWALLPGPLAAFLGALLASLYPALRLLRLRPVAAMRAA